MPHKRDCFCSCFSIKPEKQACQSLQRIGPGKGFVGPEKGFCWPCKRAAMSLMKPGRKRRKGAGNAQPKKRLPFPEISQENLDTKMHQYCRTMGVKEAMNLYDYLHLQSQQAESAKSMAKLSKLLACLLSVSPTGKIKYRYLKQTLQQLEKTWGQELLSDHWKCDKTLLAGRAADSLVVLLNHFRRVTSSSTAWSKMMMKLDEAQVGVMEQLKKQMSGKAASPSKRKLKANVSDVTLDPTGFPAMVGSTSENEEEDEEEDGKESEMDDTAVSALNKAAMEASPPPTKKAAWKEQAGILKKPASTVSKKPSGSFAPSSAKKSFAKRLDKATDKVLIHQDTLSTGGGKNQAYIQHVPGPGKNKRLIAADTTSQASQTTKTHKELVDLLLPACKKPKASKADVLAERDKLFQKYAK